MGAKRRQRIAGRIITSALEIEVPKNFCPGLRLSLRKAMKAADNITRRVRALRMAATPMPGIYWWTPTPGEDLTSIAAWRLSPFHESGGRDILHIDKWETVLKELAAFWRKDLSAAKFEYAALPRGRITEFPGKGTRMVYKVLHGGDTPPNSGGLSFVKSTFNLPLAAPAVQDPHEMMDKQDHDHLFSLLGLNSSFKRFKPPSEYDLEE